MKAAATGMVLLTLNEAAAIGAAWSSYPGPATGVLDALYGVSTIAIAVGLAAAGIAVLRAGVWTGARRWLPLATGVDAVVPMMPLMFAGFLAARLAITGWMLVFALVGWALAREASLGARARSARPARSFERTAAALLGLGSQRTSHRGLPEHPERSAR